jgi:hypothetical protein
MLEELDNYNITEETNSTDLNVLDETESSGVVLIDGEA